MILRDSSRQVLMCSLCDDRVAVTRGTAMNPETMAIRAEEMAVDHVECEKYPQDLPKARRERQYRKRMERAMRESRRKARAA